MNDIFAKCRRFVETPRIVRAEDRAIATEVFSRVSPPGNAGPWIGSNGRKLLQFSSNDYLGLAMHPEVRAAAAEVVERYGIGCPMGSRLLTGTTAEHLRFERTLAEFKRCEAALTFTSGAMAMMGLLACVAGPDDVLVMDEHAHATLVCGAKISGAEIVFFRHNDMEHLESVLAKHAGRSIAIVIDGVYSMHGDVAPMGDVVALKKRFEARLIVDDAHGTGVFGEQGRGTAAHQGVEKDIDIHAGTFSKAIGTAGGFVAGSQPVIEFLRYQSPTMVFTKAMPLAVVTATEASLALLRAGDARRKRLWENREHLQTGLVHQGLDIGNTQTPITPIHFHGSEALYVAHKLWGTYGIWVAPVMYPAVPMGHSILRVIPTAMHSPDDIDFLLDSIKKIRASIVVGALARC
jgi:8-amino-7-oxononanoate synthase